MQFPGLISLKNGKGGGMVLPAVDKFLSDFLFAKFFGQTARDRWLVLVFGLGTRQVRIANVALEGSIEPCSA